MLQINPRPLQLLAFALAPIHKNVKRKHPVELPLDDVHYGLVYYDGATGQAYGLVRQQAGELERMTY